MHPVADKIKLTAFDGTVELLSRKVDVSFDDGAADSSSEFTEPSTLIIRGLTMEEAFDMMAAATKATTTVRAAPVPEGPPAEGKPAHHEDRVADEARRKSEAIEKVKASTAAAAAAHLKPTAPAAAAKLAPAPPPVADPAPGADADDLGDDVADEGEDGELDVAAMNAHEKLRPVIEHMIERGYKTAADIVSAALPLRNEVAAFKAVDAKGGFEKRIERAALVVLAGDDGGA